MPAAAAAAAAFHFTLTAFRWVLSLCLLSSLINTFTLETNFHKLYQYKYAYNFIAVFNLFRTQKVHIQKFILK